MWADAAAYEYYIGRWSRRVAPKFLKSLEIPPDSRWSDIGCGTGILSQTILNLASPHSVVGFDTSEEYVEFAREQIHDRRIAFHLGDAQSLPVEPAEYDAVVCGLVPNFIPQPSLALSSMIRVCAPRWNDWSIRLGLRGPDATHSVLLGCCCCSRQNDIGFR